MNIANFLYKSDCRHFNGTVPCKPHKNKGFHCSECPVYDKTDGIILIIKLGAIGDVIRTTPLIHKIKKEHPSKKIWWLTYSPEVVPSIVDKVFNYDLESIEIIKSTKFDLLINLDKDLQAGAIANIVVAAKKMGFTLSDGIPKAINNLAEAKFITGLFDDANKLNQKSYLEEIFEICDWKFDGEEYILDCDENIKWDLMAGDKKIIGLNTGCGARWVSRLWSDENWLDLIDRLQQNGYFPILLGGKQEDEKNKFFAEKSGAYYPGYFSLNIFISLMNQCDLIVSAVTMGMHIAVALRKPLVLMNNIFNPKEFELYGRGEIVQPNLECKCFFSPKCKNEEYFCMDFLTVDAVLGAVLRSIK